MKRSEFIRNSAMVVAGISLRDNPYIFEQEAPLVNKLPYWKGFNLLDFFSPDPASNHPASMDEHFKWMSDWGFNFVRLPLAYPNYLQFDRTKNITPEQVYRIDEKRMDAIESIVAILSVKA